MMSEQSVAREEKLKMLAEAPIGTPRPMPAVKQGPRSKDTRHLPEATRRKLREGFFLDQFERHLRAGNKAAMTIRSYVGSVDNFTEFLSKKGMPTDPANVTREHIEAWIVGQLDAGYATASVNIGYRSLQQYWKWLIDEGEITVSPMAKMHPPKTQDKPVPVLSDVTSEVSEAVDVEPITGVPPDAGSNGQDCGKIEAPDETVQHVEKVIKTQVGSTNGRAIQSEIHRRIGGPDIGGDRPFGVAAALCARVCGEQSEQTTGKNVFLSHGIFPVLKIIIRSGVLPGQFDDR
ncbi:MAG: site-specific integrase [Proteobacteria bacterium]|nr:site-specific integrase [Pseudomonadota bacterium]